MTAGNGEEGRRKEKAGTSVARSAKKVLVVWESRREGGARKQMTWPKGRAEGWVGTRRRTGLAGGGEMNVGY